MNPQSDNLVWLDLEMTGLNPEQDRIIEIATIVTNSNLEILAEGPVFAIQQPAELLQGMDAWNTKTHTHSGLVQRVQSSQITDLIAEEATLDFIMQYVPPGKSPMCGNSIGQDRRFLCRYMPALEKYFHYRNLDVSTVKELAKRWLPQIAAGYNKTSTHQALQDIRDSIAELYYYRQHIFHLD